MADKEKEYKKLRSYLNQSIKGKNTEAILKSLAVGPVHLINNVEAVNDSLYIVSAQEKYLDYRLGDKGVSRPPEVGLSDDIFREIGIEITNRAQIRDLIHQLLRILYGESFTRATSASSKYGNYSLEENDNLIISFDDSDPVEVIFNEDQFLNINQATAQEVADAITKSIRKKGKTGAAFYREEELGNKIVLISSTDGPSSSVKVLGGKAQNIFQFDIIRETTGDTTTQWTISQQTGGAIRATWVGGNTPLLGKIKIGDYVNIYGDVFSPFNRGTFTITNVKGGSAGSSYIEFENPNGITEKNEDETLKIITQNNKNDILFFYPKKNILTSNARYSAAFQSSPRTIEVFMPATTRVVRRSRQGAAHIYQENYSLPKQEGPYSFDTTINYTISNQSTFIEEKLNVASDIILSVNNSSNFPDEPGHVMLGLGTTHQEGPIPYISRPSSQTIRINPSYKFKNNHPIGTDVSLVVSLTPPILNKDATDIPFYITDSAAGRIYGENLIKEIAATGITIIFYTLYPNDEGLGKWGDETNSEKYYIWGTIEDL